MGLREVFHNIWKLVWESCLRFTDWRCVYKSCLTMTWDLLREMKMCGCSPWRCIFVSLRLLKVLSLHCIIKVVCFLNILVLPSIIVYIIFLWWRKWIALKFKMILSRVCEWNTCKICSLYRKHCDLFPLLLKIGLNSFQPSNCLFLPLE